jgi:hypothetical protein
MLQIVAIALLQRRYSILDRVPLRYCIFFTAIAAMSAISRLTTKVRVTTPRQLTQETSTPSLG